MYKNSVLSIGLLLFFVQLSWSQCHPERHNTSIHDGWYSCIQSTNPNPGVRPVSHWLQYDFGYVYSLGSSHFWNANHPDLVNNGVKRAAIDYSLDGQNWIEAGEFEFDMGSGRSIYEGSSGPDFDGIEARYLLLTVLETYGGGECTGFSEWKIDVEGRTTSTADLDPGKKINIYPNPFSGSTKIDLTGFNHNVHYEVRDILGRSLISADLQNSREFELYARDLHPGHYILRVFDGESWVHAKIICID